MLLTITNTSPPADDLSFLLHKHPNKVQTFELNFGKAHVFYPECSSARCTAALLLDVDPIVIVRGKEGSRESGYLQQYINNRPYVASSYLSVAIAQVLRSAMSGISAERPHRVDEAMLLEARIAALATRGGEALIRRLFEPLGYVVELEGGAIIPEFETTTGHCVALTLRGTMRLRDLLSHLYVLIPALDDEKHYWIGKDEMEKLLRRGEGWLASHPERELIVDRYLRHQRHWVRATLAQLIEDATDPDEITVDQLAEEGRVEEKFRLNDLRLGSVLAALKSCGARSVVDLGCGEGKLLAALLADRQFERIVGMDVSPRVLERAAEKLRLDRLPSAQKDRVRLIHGSLAYRDHRLQGFDAATLVEVIEHLDPPRLRALERALFEHMRPRTIVVTTPNVEYNELFESLPAGRLRHRDHRFEWTRAEFQGWCHANAERFSYVARFLPVGPEHEALGPPTQMAVFVQP